jgi:hypothetical protein
MHLDDLKFNLPEKWFKDEASFTTYFGRQIKEKWGFFHKISDADRWLKPMDAVFALNGIVWWIEFKITDSMKSKPYTKLRWSCPQNSWWQVKWLTTLMNNWWTSLVILYNRKVNAYKIIDFKDFHLDTNIDFTCSLA